MADDSQNTTLRSSESNIHESINNIRDFIDPKDVQRMMSLQESAIDRLEATNRSLASCQSLAQEKLAATTKLFKKTAKEMSDAKKDLDIVYTKLSELKRKIKAEQITE